MAGKIRVVRSDPFDACIYVYSRRKHILAELQPIQPTTFRLTGVSLLSPISYIPDYLQDYSLAVAMTSAASAARP